MSETIPSATGPFAFIGILGIVTGTIAHFSAKSKFKKVKIIQDSLDLPVSQMNEQLKSLSNNEEIYVCVRGLISCKRPLLTANYDNSVETVAKKTTVTRITEVQHVQEKKQNSSDKTKNQRQQTTSSFEKQHDVISVKKDNIPFYINDNTGMVLIECDFDQLPLKNVYKHFVPETMPSSQSINVNVNTGAGEMLGQIGSKSLGHEHNEWILPMDRTLTCIGNAHLDEDDGLILSPGNNTDKPFILQLDKRKSAIVNDERKVAENIDSVSKVFYSIGTICLIVSGVLVLSVKLKK